MKPLRNTIPFSSGPTRTREYEAVFGAGRFARLDVTAAVLDRPSRPSWLQGPRRHPPRERHRGRRRRVPDGRRRIAKCPDVKVEGHRAVARFAQPLPTAPPRASWTWTTSLHFPPKPLAPLQVRRRSKRSSLLAPPTPRAAVLRKGTAQRASLPLHDLATRGNRRQQLRRRRPCRTFVPWPSSSTFACASAGSAPRVSAMIFVALDGGWRCLPCPPLSPHP